MFNFDQMLDYIPSVLFLIGVVLVIFMVVLPTLKALSAMGGTVLSVTQTGGGGGSIIMNNLGGGDGGSGGGAIGGGGGGAGSSINIANVEGRVRESVVKKVVEVVDKHPEETVQLVRSWAASGGGSSNDQA
jgi:flagellar M-ring protein FliF